MTELEQRLTNEFGKLAEQYEQVGKRYAEGVNFMTLLAEDQQKMGAHITKLTDAYEKQNSTCNEFTNAFNALVVDLNELFR